LKKIYTLLKTKKHQKSLAALSLVVFTVAGSLFLLELRDAEYIVISHNDSTKNAGPLTILNLKSGETWKPNVPRVGCNGIAENKSGNDNELLVYCMGSSKNNNLWDVSLANRSFAQHTLLPAPYEAISVPLHAKVIVSSVGWQYFNSGGPGYNENWDATDAGVVAVKGDEAHKILISDRSKPYFILRMVLDEEESELWMMSSGNGESVLIDRIDLINKKVDFSYTIKSYSGFDMIVNNDDVVVTTYRTSAGIDITVLNKLTGEKKKEITLPSKEDLGYNALSMLVRGERLYVSSIGGLYAFDKSTYEIKEFIENNPRSQFSYLVNGKRAIYAIDSYDRVFEIPDRDMMRTKLLIDGEGQGLTSLYYYVINK
jgi:hypothetical protein